LGGNGDFGFSIYRRLRAYVSYAWDLFRIWGIATDFRLARKGGVIIAAVCSAVRGSKPPFLNFYAYLRNAYLDA
jgi:hypothetical protein